MVLHNLGGVKCQPFLKNSAYYVADLIPLIADSLFFRARDFAESFCFQAISIQKIAWHSKQTLLTQT